MKLTHLSIYVRYAVLLSMVLEAYDAYSNSILAINSLMLSCTTRKLLKYWRNLPEGFARPENSEGKLLAKRPLPPKELIRVNTVQQLKDIIRNGYRVQDIDVRGNLMPLSIDDLKVHPVVKLLHDRKYQNSKPGDRQDKVKIALAIEGGGMRGCVAAGMVTAINHLGLDESIDIVYGSSAGSLVGAYFITKQLPYEGPEVYYDILVSAGKQFIDSSALLRCCGLGLLDIRPRRLASLLTDRMGKPILDLNFVFEKIVKHSKPLNWEYFWSRQKVQPLKIVASGLLSKRSVILSAEEGNFRTMDELAQCMKASMSLPGITGDAIRLKGQQAEGNNLIRTLWPEYETRTKKVMVPGSEPLSDALIFEPLPYRSAFKEGCTHAIVLRTRADDISVTVKMSTIEKLIMSRFFGRKQKLPELVNWMHNQYHKLVYAEDILTLNEASRNFTDQSNLYAIALPKGIPEVSRMETSRSVIFENVRFGFAAAYDALVLDPSLRGQGLRVAKEIWPDEILNAPPKSQ